MREVTAFVLAARVHDPERAGQGLSCEMMVNDHDVRLRDCGNRLERMGAAIHANDKAVGFGEPAHGGRVGSVALGNSIGHVEGRVVTLLSEPVEEKRGRCAAVHVIVGKDRNPFLVGQGANQPRRNDVGISELPGIGKEVAEPWVKELPCVFGRDAPIRENAAKGVGQPGLLPKRVCHAE